MAMPANFALQKKIIFQKITDTNLELNALVNLSIRQFAISQIRQSSSLSVHFGNIYIEPLHQILCE